MNKKAIINPVVLIFLVVAVVGIAIFPSINELAIFEDDYITYDDFQISENFDLCQQASKTVQNTDPSSISLKYFSRDGNIIGNFAESKNVQCVGDRWSAKAINGNGRGEGLVDTKDGYMRVVASGSTGKAEVKNTQNFKGKDVKIVASVSLGGERPVSATIGYGGIDIYSKTYESRKTLDEELVITIIPLLTEDKSIVTVNGKETLINSPDGIITFTTIGEKNSFSEILVKQVKFRYPFNCQVENDEVVVFDDFTAGSQFRISDLKFEPVKFCTDSYPTIVRSFDAQGVDNDRFGEITRNLAKGKTILVPVGQTYSVYYIADYQDGSNLRCELGQAYDTQSKKCVQLIEEQEDVLELGSNVKEADTGVSQVTFSNGAQIGDIDIITSPPKFSCDGQGFAFNAPQPQEQCWSTSVKFENFEKEIFWGTSADINQYFNVRYVGEARWEATPDSSGITDYNNQMILTVKNKDYIKISGQEQEPFVKLNEKKQIAFNIENKLASFDASQSGLRIVKSTDLIQTQTNTLLDFAIPKGKNAIVLDAQSDQLGQITYIITPYVVISGQKIFDDQSAFISYYVYDQEKSDIAVIQPGNTIFQTGNVEENAKGLFARLLEWLQSLF